MPALTPLRSRGIPTPAPALPPDTDHLFPENTCLLQGMHGMGDNIHQRAVIRHRLSQGKDVYLTSSWVSIYHDLLPLGLKVIRRETNLRSQTDNANREDPLFYRGVSPSQRSKYREQIWYRSEHVNNLGSVLAAMCYSTKTPLDTADFSLLVPSHWSASLHEKLRPYKIPGDVPIMVVRPLVERRDWSGCSARNPDVSHYMDLYTSIRKDFFVISVADLKDRFEWISSPGMNADLELHKAELNFEQLAALFTWADLVYGSPGFAIPLAQSVGTPSICVFGGFERSFSFSAGTRHAPHLAIGPIEQCGCWKHDHACPKKIDMQAALHAVKEFAGRYVDA